MARGYTLFKRKAKRGSVWYYKLNDEKTAHSTGRTTKSDADDFVREEVLKRTEAEKLTLREFLEPFYTSKGPHVTRYRQEGKSMSQRHVEDQRARMEKHIFSDPICKRKVGDLRVHDFLEFRSRLLDGDVGKRTVNRAIGILKTAYKEAVYREQLDRNPVLGVTPLKYGSQEIGTFSAHELEKLFERRPGKFEDLYAYCAFLLAASWKR
jgi:hypothetical protein